MTTILDVFISSKMVELKAERDALYDLLPTLDYGDIKLRAWVFEEDAPASSAAIRKIYLKALQNSALYLGLFWNLYGEWTIDEFDRATELGMERHIYVKDVDADKRDPKLSTFLYQHGDVPTGITAKWFKTTDELRAAVKHSIESWIVERLRSRPGGTSAILANDPDDLSEKPRKLIGRDELLGDIAKLLDDSEQILLQGFGGMGKTALAATAAGEWIRAGKGTVLWLKTGSASADAVFEALARPFNTQQAIAGMQDEAKIQAVRQQLRGSGAKLLVLDDCWNGQALFTVLKAVPSDMPVLATARQRFAMDNMLDVGELKPDDAMTLLLHHAKFTLPPGPLPEFREGEQEREARALCKTLGNHAFAIEIAGKTLKARKWTPAELLQEIKDAPHDLKIPSDFNEAERKSVKDLLDASVNLLTDDEKAVFLAFGAFFAPQLTAEMLMRYFRGKPKVSDKMIVKARAWFPNLPNDVSDDKLQLLIENGLFWKADIDPQPIKTVLDILEIHGLVERIQASPESVEHYRIHDLSYTYSGAQTNKSQRKRALDACIAYTERYNQPNLENFSALEPEIENLLGAARFAFESNNYEVLSHLTGNLITNEGSNILDFRGFYTQAIFLLERCLELSRRHANRVDEDIWLGNLGNAYFNVGEHLRAIEYQEQALAIARQIFDKRVEASILGNLGNAYFNEGEYLRAIEHQEQALVIARQIGNKQGESNHLGNLGNAYFDMGERHRAIEYFEQALAITQEIGDKRGESIHLSNLGKAYFNEGEYLRAIEHQEQALVIARQIGDKRGEGQTLLNIGITYADLEEYKRANEAYEQAQAIFVSIGVKHLVERVEQLIAKTQAKLDTGDTSS